MGFEGDGDQRLYLPDGTYPWTQFDYDFSTPDGCTGITFRFASDNTTKGYWIDDLSLERSPAQRTDLEEHREPKDFSGVFPRSTPPIAPHLYVYDCRRDADDVAIALAALQGIVNRQSPQLYLIHKTNPPDYDEIWLTYMKEKGYTGSELRLATSAEVFERFRTQIAGRIIYDPNLPGSVHAATMLSGLEQALPVSPEMDKDTAVADFPVVMDLRGMWKRNVDAYRFVYDHHWDRMNHHVLAWEYPLASFHGSLDYFVQFNIFQFWASKYSDPIAGADPSAEDQFLHELFANTPANIPVMGWPSYSDTQGWPEYTGVRLCSEYGKFVPGTEFCTNLSVHTAIQPEPSVYRQRQPKPDAMPRLHKEKVYVAFNVLDSGDALWYWQLQQRNVWADPARGRIPIGWCMNVTLHDALPLVAQWYYENATPNDTFFAALSGLGYMNTAAYASRFRKPDRDRIWNEYLELTDEYCQRMDIHGVETYNGSWGEPTPPSPETFKRYADQIDNLDYIFADLGRHDCINATNANTLIGGTAVFHTLTRYLPWSTSTEVLKQGREPSIQHLLGEIQRHTPENRPGFMSVMVLSWTFTPSWIGELAERLPDDYEAVSPAQLAALFRENEGVLPP